MQVSAAPARLKQTIAPIPCTVTKTEDGSGVTIDNNCPLELEEIAQSIEPGEYIIRLEKLEPGEQQQSANGRQNFEIPVEPTGTKDSPPKSSSEIPAIVPVVAAAAVITTTLTVIGAVRYRKMGKDEPM